MAVSLVNNWSNSWCTQDANVTQYPVNHTLQISITPSTGNWLIAFISIHGAINFPIGSTISVGDDACNNWTPLTTSPFIPPTSLALNTNPSFESGTTGWVGSAATLAAVTNIAYSSTHSCLVTPNGTSTTAGLQTGFTNISPNLFYTGSMWLNSPSGYTGVRPFLSWFTASTSPVFISATLGSTYGVVPNFWSQVTVAGQAPSNAGKVVFGVSLLNNPQTWDYIYADLGTLTTGNGWSAGTRVSIWAAPNIRSGTTTLSIAPLQQVNALAAITYEMSGLPTWLTASPVASGFVTTSSTITTSVTPTQSSLIVTTGADNAVRYRMERVRSTWSAGISTSVNNSVDANGDLSMVTSWQVSSSPQSAFYYGVFASNTNPIFQSSTTGWQISGGTAAFSASVGYLTPFHSALITPNGTSANVDFSVTHATAPAVTPFSTYVANIQAVAPNTSAVSVQVGIEWLTAGLATISTTFSTAISVPGGSVTNWYSQAIQAIAPSNAAFASVHVRLTGTPPTGHHLNVGEAAISLVTGAVSGVSFIHSVGTAAAAAAIQLSPTAPAQPNSTWPNLQLEVAFGQGAGIPPDQLTYTNISNRLFAATVDRGRQYELNAVQAANVTLILRNDDGLLTPGSSAAGAFKVQVYNPFRLYAIWNNQRYNICVGYIERWPQTWADAHFGLVPAIGVDSWAMVTPTIQSVVRNEILLDQPLHYWPLADPAGNSSAANLGYYNTALTVKPSPFGVSSSVANFGASNVALVGDTGTNWQLTGLKSSSSQAAFGYSLSYNGPNLPPIPTDSQKATTICFWFHIPDTGPITKQAVTIMTIGSPAGPSLVIQMQGTTTLTVTVYDAATGVPTTSSPTAFGYSNLTTPLALKFYTGGYSLFLNGGQVIGSIANLNPNWSYLTFAGRNDNTFTGTYGNMSFSHIAIFPRPLPTSRLYTYNYAGQNGMAGDFADWRVSRLLSYLTWGPPQRIYYDVATNQLSGATDISGSDVGTSINNVGQTEQALEYIDRNGYLTFRTRQAALNRGVQCVLGENTTGGEIPYRVTLEIDYDPQYINNDIQVTHKGTPPFQGASSTTSTTVKSSSTSTTILVRNTNSINKYGDHSLQVTSYFSAVQESVNLSNYLINQYSEPLMRVAQVEVVPGTRPVVFSTILGLDIGDRVTLNRRPIGANNVISLDVTIIGVHHDIEEKSGKWSFKLDIIPTSIAAIQTKALKLDTAVVGALDSTNVIGW